jgi:hypothetical protein
MLVGYSTTEGVQKMPFTSDNQNPVTTTAVNGDGVVLVTGTRGDVSLYDVTGRSLGTFTNVRDAWAALDALDAAA